jgi:hypothetical protein
MDNNQFSAFLAVLREISNSLKEQAANAKESVALHREHLRLAQEAEQRQRKDRDKLMASADMMAEKLLEELKDDDDANDWKRN